MEVVWEVTGLPDALIAKFVSWPKKSPDDRGSSGLGVFIAI